MNLKNLIIILALATAVLFAGCTQQQEQTNSTATTPPQKEVVQPQVSEQLQATVKEEVKPPEAQAPVAEKKVEPNIPAPKLEVKYTNQTYVAYSYPKPVVEFTIRVTNKGTRTAEGITVDVELSGYPVGGSKTQKLLNGGKLSLPYVILAPDDSVTFPLLIEENGTITTIKMDGRYSKATDFVPYNKFRVTYTTSPNVEYGGTYCDVKIINEGTKEMENIKAYVMSSGKYTDELTLAGHFLPAGQAVESTWIYTARSRTADNNPSSMVCDPVFVTSTTGRN